jgi:hypothetical protein
MARIFVTGAVTPQKFVFGFRMLHVGGTALKFSGESVFQ